MNRQSEIKCSYFLVLLISLLFLLPCANSVTGAEIPTAWDVASRKAELPTIEDLTAGKVKKGDVIDKSNVDLVKQWLTPGTIEAIMQGMILTMGTNSNPYDGVPKEYVEATEKNKGKAVMDENRAVYYEKIGTPWPGGIPYPEPKNGDEVMAILKYGVGIIDYVTDGVLRFVNRDGKVYKNVGMSTTQVWVSNRIFPPLGTYPGYEGQMFRRVSTLTFPVEIKGQGQFAIRYYDDSKQYDSGFAYFPAYKRTLRISTTTWQDNIAGSDLTNGDSEGFREPYADWKFKLIGTEYLLIPEHRAPFPYISNKGMDCDPRLKWDVGVRFPRIGWAVFPVFVVEAVPTVKHIYGKKILYLGTPPYLLSSGAAEIMESYDRQGNLWKYYVNINGLFVEKWHSSIPFGVVMTDLQSQHTTQFLFNYTINQNVDPARCSLKELLARGR
ncbi:conserved exported hypothetical protein [uncultured Desulfobacterium sp.]|uniref:DUF1329 domain-containing protein n=1 Tax=uncultured Desulfobacterium sp. TaxID=201089 RepID=A0A445MW83_9BACT|nr:conserved exported hypothetical protein [uncultured Desulfobacterium sp.]